MKITAIFLVATLAVASTGCRNDWKIDGGNDSPTAESPDGFGAVGVFDTDEKSVLFAIEAPSKGIYSVSVAGRASSEISGSGIIRCGDSEAELRFDSELEWSNRSVELMLDEGINYVEICKGDGNGLFLIDRIQVENAE